VRETEPLLLKITRRYKDIEETVPQHQGYLSKSIQRLFLARLKAGERQAPHVDGGDSSVSPNKIHVPVFSEGGASLMFKQTGFRRVPHARWVRVRGQLSRDAFCSSRLHLIFEFFPLDVGSQWTDAIAPEKRHGVQARRAGAGRSNKRSAHKRSSVTKGKTQRARAGHGEL